jgi:hypothetical protein
MEPGLLIRDAFEICEMDGVEEAIPDDHCKLRSLNIRREVNHVRQDRPRIVSALDASA